MPEQPCFCQQFCLNIVEKVGKAWLWVRQNSSLMTLHFYLIVSWKCRNTFKKMFFLIHLFWLFTVHFFLIKKKNVFFLLFTVDLETEGPCYRLCSYVSLHALLNTEHCKQNRIFSKTNELHLLYRQSSANTEISINFSSLSGSNTQRSQVHVKVKALAKLCIHMPCIPLPPLVILCVKR